MSKKKVSISADDNIISEPDVALKLAKSISLAKTVKEEEPRQLKGIQTLTAKEQLAADMMQALNARKKSSRSQLYVGGFSEGTGTKPRVPDESTAIITTSHEGTGIKPGDEEIKDVEVAETRKSNEEITDMEKADTEKTEEVNDDNKKAELPLLSSSLSVSSGFGNQFLNLSFDKSTVRNLKDTTYADINSSLDVQIQQEIPHIQYPSILIVHVSMIPEPIVLSPIPEIPNETPETTL
ncbi:hypothetical protein Tco_1365161 [Tanacetum coccineum]